MDPNKRREEYGYPAIHAPPPLRILRNRRHPLRIPYSSPGMAPTENKSLIRRLYAEGLNRQDAVVAAAFYSENAMNHGHAVGRAGMQKVFEALFATFPDFHYEILNATAEGDRV